MTSSAKPRLLRIALGVFGLIFLLGVYPLTVYWPSGWAWHAGHSQYLEMIMAIYATLGVFLLIASRHPPAHTSLIAFTLWSSAVHGALMAVQALQDPAAHAGHLWGDVPALLAVAGVLGWLCPQALRLQFDRRGAARD
jgi:uncharacterized protein DUF6632